MENLDAMNVDRLRGRFGRLIRQRRVKITEEPTSRLRSEESDLKIFRQQRRPLCAGQRREVTALPCPVLLLSTPLLFPPSLLLKISPPSLLSTAFMQYDAIPS